MLDLDTGERRMPLAADGGVNACVPVTPNVPMLVTAPVCGFTQFQIELPPVRRLRSKVIAFCDGV